MLRNETVTLNASCRFTTSLHESDFCGQVTKTAHASEKCNVNWSFIRVSFTCHNANRMNEVTCQVFPQQGEDLKPCS